MQLIWLEVPEKGCYLSIVEISKDPRFLLCNEGIFQIEASPSVVGDCYLHSVLHLVVIAQQKCSDREKSVKCGRYSYGCSWRNIER